MSFNKGMVVYALIFFITLGSLTHGHAGTTPKFTVSAVSPTSLIVVPGEVTTVMYTVTNNTPTTRTLTIKNIPGISISTTPPGACSNPFTLAQNQSCNLMLTVTGSNMTSSIIGGPEVCKTMGNGNNNPDPFLCSQPVESQILRITTDPTAIAEIFVEPSMLAMMPNSAANQYSITVTNLSSEFTANNIQATLPADWDVTQDASACVSLAPNSSCPLTFTTGSSQESMTNVPIAGSDTNTQTVNMGVVEPEYAVLSITNPAQADRYITVNSGTRDLTLQNNPSSQTTTTVESVSLPAEWTNVTVSIPMSCTNIAVGGICIISLSSTSPYEPGTITINYTNKSPSAPSLTTPIAFQTSGVGTSGWVFYARGSVTKIARTMDSSSSSGAAWYNGAFTNIIGATSLDHGNTNTDAIVFNQGGGTYAASLCDTIGWDLPAICELGRYTGSGIDAGCGSSTPNLYSTLYQNGFGSLSGGYWSSTQYDTYQAWTQGFNRFGTQIYATKNNVAKVRCIRTV